MTRRWLSLIPISALAIMASTGLAGAQSMDQIMAGAKSEGTLTVIALLGATINLMEMLSAVGIAPRVLVIRTAALSGLGWFAIAVGMGTAVPLIVADVLFMMWRIKVEMRLKRMALELLPALRPPR